MPISPTSQVDWGLQGWSKIVANLGVIGVVCMLLIFSFYSTRDDHRDDMRMFRDELHKQREHDAELRRSTNMLIMANQKAIDETLRLVAGLAKDVALLANEVRQVKRGPGG